MQPYFFPYLGYFQLISAVDRFVLFDDAQFTKGSWINRNRILKDESGWRYINVPITGRTSSARIRDLRIAAGGWQSRILRQLEHYRSKAPYFSEVTRMLDDAFENTESGVTGSNGRYLQSVCNYVGVDFNISTSSALNLDFSGVRSAGDWGLVVSEQLGASEYINMLGGRSLFDSRAFAERGIGLTFLEPRLRVYDQKRTSFEPALSIIDVLMFNPRDAVRAMFREPTRLESGSLT